jgi:hypothetical protein
MAAKVIVTRQLKYRGIADILIDPFRASIENIIFVKRVIINFLSLKIKKLSR